MVDINMIGLTQIPKLNATCRVDKIFTTLLMESVCKSCMIWRLV